MVAFEMPLETNSGRAVGPPPRQLEERDGPVGSFMAKTIHAMAPFRARLIEVEKK